MSTRRPIADRERGLFMISVAAELARVHPQTLRMYEVRGLIQPKRSPGGTRLYSQVDIDRMRRIGEMTELGMNLVAVERVFALEDELARMSVRMRALEKRAHDLHEAMEQEIEAVRRQFRAEVVPYRAPGTSLVPIRRVGVKRRSTTISHISRRER